MVQSLQLLAVAALASTVLAKYPKLDFVKKTVQRDASRLRRRSGPSDGSVDVTLVNSQTSQNTLEYWVNVTVGTPPQSMALQLDTGSSDFWVMASSADLCQQGQCLNGFFNANASRSVSFGASDFNIS